MSIGTFLSLISFILYLILGLYVLTKNIKNKTNILFFLVAITLALWTLMQFFASITENREIFNYWIKASLFFCILFFTFNFIFFMELTLTGRYKKSLVFLAFIPSILLIIKFMVSKELLHVKVSRVDNFWIYEYTKTIWTFLLFGIGSFYLFISLLILYLWGNRTGLKKAKMQSIIISICLLLTVIFILLEALILPMMTSYKSLGLSHDLVLVWILGIFYSITKYRFLSITPEIISNDVISNITELIILLDENLKIILANKKTEELIGIEKNKIINKDLSEIILKYDLIKNEADKMLKNQYKDFSCRIYFKSNDEPVLIDAKFSKVFDKFNDLIGILIIGMEVKELKQLKLFYKLSDREVEIVQLIIEGLSNKEIGANTNLTENTIKSHVMHIFNKLNVNNRIEMLNLLTEYNLIPRSSNSKKILLLK